MEDLLYAVRVNSDGTYSLMVRVRNPSSSYWLHPTHVGYTSHDDILRIRNKFEQSNLSIEEIMSSWNPMDI